MGKAKTPESNMNKTAAKKAAGGAPQGKTLTVEQQ